MGHDYSRAIITHLDPFELTSKRYVMHINICTTDSTLAYSNRLTKCSNLAKHGNQLLGVNH